MSHFTLVVQLKKGCGNLDAALERALAPFDESLKVAPYRRAVGAWEIEYAKKQDGRIKSHEAVAAKLNREFWDGEDEDSRYLCDADGVYQMVTYNPQSRWDWYNVGGRWSGFWWAWEPFHTGRRGNSIPRDVVRKVDIDWETMQDDAAKKAGEQWDRVHATIDPHPPITPWPDVLAKHEDGKGKENLDAARDEYNAQPGVAAIRADSDNPAYWDGAEPFLCSREDFIHRAILAAGMPFAFLLANGEWVERGKMGWWGVVHDDSPSEDWHRAAHRIYDTIPGEDILVLVDCHI